MTYELDAEGIGRLEKYFEEIGVRLGEKRRRASFALYAMGILGEHERKSVEPLAAAAADDPDGAQRTHDHLLHFIGQSEWDDGPLREFAARHAVHAMESRERISAWVIDDTGFMKQGRESPGVQRQYTGTVGKIANCQIGVSLTLCTPTEHVPVDMQLYLPESWIQDRARCDRAKIPRNVGFRPKWQMALEMMESAVQRRLPKGVVLADAAYGNVGEFRAGLRWLNFEYAVGVNANTVVTRTSKTATAASPMSVEALALPRGAFRATTWKQGSRRALWSRFAMLQVDACTADGGHHWLLIEWPDGEKAPTHYTLARLRKAPSRIQLVRITKERWRTERVFSPSSGRGIRTQSRKQLHYEQLGSGSRLRPRQRMFTWVPSPRSLLLRSTESYCLGEDDGHTRSLCAPRPRRRGAPRAPCNNSARPAAICAIQPPSAWQVTPAM